jgi:signal transduction histidine kinase
MRKRLGKVAGIGSLAAAYLIAARLGLAFDAVAGFATLVWPPTGIAIAALVLRGPGLWPGILIGAFVANLLAGASVPVALGIAIGNTLEAVAGAWLLRRIPNFSTTLETVQSAIGIIAVSMCSTLISASVGVTSLFIGHVIVQSGIRGAWRSWWIGDMVGALLITPIILVWASAPRARFRASRTELVTLAMAVIVISVMTFFGDHVPVLATPFHQTDVLYAVLIWAALRFGQRGATTVTLSVSAMAIAATTLGHGPFVEAQLSQSLLSLQTFMAIIAVTLLVLGATICERRIAYGEAERAHIEAQGANLAKSEFLAVMSHELRTPLNAIAGYAQLLETDVYGSLNGKQTDAVDRIRANEQNLLSIIDEVLGFVSAERGEVTVEGKDVAVADAFDAVEPLIQLEVRRKHFVLTRALDAPTLAVHADPRSLQTILLSLLSNASKYTQDGGTITLGADRSGSSVRIWVRDTGVGIPQEEMQRVFEPFFQAERGKTRRYSGVGLGLTIARDLAHRMEGDVTIASTLGTGTTATVVLPAA